MYSGAGFSVLLGALSLALGERIVFLDCAFLALWLPLDVLVALRRSGVRCILFLVHAEYVTVRLITF